MIAGFLRLVKSQSLPKGGGGDKRKKGRTTSEKRKRKESRGNANLFPSTHQFHRDWIKEFSPNSCSVVSQFRISITNQTWERFLLTQDASREVVMQFGPPMSFIKCQRPMESCGSPGTGASRTTGRETKTVSSSDFTAAESRQC